MSKKILIAYFSHGGENLVDDSIQDIGEEGNTAKIAKALKEALAFLDVESDLFEIDPMIPYPYLYDETVARAKEEKAQGARPLIENGPASFQDYDLVFLGYPNWWGSVPMPVMTFLDNHDFTNKTVIPFITHGGQLFMYSLEEIRREVPKAEVIEGFAVAAAYMDTGALKIADWLSEHTDLFL